MFGKSKPEAPFPSHEFADRLAKLVRHGMAAGMSAGNVETELQSYVNGLRARAAN
jgi:hypothetical protein